MKNFFQTFVLLFTLATNCAIAQSSLVATLNHQGNISVYNGNDALIEAHAAATDGDVITLSSGGFMATDIKKAITLRGAGMQIDSISNTMNTVILGNFRITIPDSITQRLSIENIFSNDSVIVSAGLRNATFLKCRLGDLKLSNAVSTKPASENNRFIHCRITKSLNVFGNSDDKRNQAFFINSYIYKTRSSYGALEFTNCIINNSDYNNYYDFLNLGYSIFYNCILICYNSNSLNNQLPSSSIAYNCVGVNYISYKYAPFYYMTNSTNYLAGSIFKTYKYSDDYDDDETFELTDEAKTKYLGTDGKQVGIHGGSLPYSPTPANPRITKCNVASHSTSDGKLSVEIEVKSE